MINYYMPIKKHFSKKRIRKKNKQTKKKMKHRIKKTKKGGANNNNKTSGKLLMISDLEGCEPFSRDKKAQSQAMCKDVFFYYLIMFMEKNQANRIAFLGDYFDKGPYVLSTIEHIVKLKNRYKERIYIILGNRDINKLRLLYEVESVLPIPRNEGNGWKMWTNFYEKYKTAETPEDRIKTIFDYSMGAPHTVGLNINNTTIEDGINKLRSIFNKKIVNVNMDTYGYDIRTLFQEGQIVAYDEPTKTLLSHGGGFNVPFHTYNYYKNMIDTMPQSLNYFEKIEYFRRQLQEPLQPQQNPNETTNINDYIKTLNKPLKDVVENRTFPNTPSNEFCLLQALGLKPDPGKQYNSYIESCGTTSCNNIVRPLKDEFISLMNQLGVNTISAGHVPHCAPVPLIYQRKGLNFIANDTSNGYRPVEITKLNFPISYVSKDKIGITSMDKEISNKDNIYKEKMDNSDACDYSIMVQDFTNENMPQFIDNENKIIYNNEYYLNFVTDGKFERPNLIGCPDRQMNS